MRITVRIQIRQFASCARSLQQQASQPLTKPPKPISPHAAIYKEFGIPWIKVVGTAFVSYYGLIYLWQFLESSEPQVAKVVEE